jgi:hypothetical protein
LSVTINGNNVNVGATSGSTSGSNSGATGGTTTVAGGVNQVGVPGTNTGTNTNTVNPTSVVVGSGFTGVSAWGFGGGGETVQRMLPGPAQSQVMGPMQVTQMLPQAVPTVLGMREVFTNGVPTTITAPVVTEYRWPVAQAAAYVPYVRPMARVYRRHAQPRVMKHHTQPRILK